MKKKILSLVFAAILIFNICIVPVTATETESEASPSLAIETFSLSLENAVYMNFKVSSENVTNVGDIKILVWKSVPYEYAKGTEDLCLVSKGTEGDTGYELFQYTDLAAKDMTKTVYVCAYANVDGKAVYSAPAKFSISMYAYLKKNATNPDTSLVELLDGMLAYGALAQKYWSYNTDFLATDTIFQVDVVNGKLEDGFAKGWYKHKTEATLIAEEKEGYTFSHWENSAGENVGATETIKVEVISKETYTAVYEESEIVYSEGLEYALSNDATYYIVSGIGDCTDTDIIIPNTYNAADEYGELPVKAIAQNAFENNTTILNVKIPNSIIDIGNDAFLGCESITNITIPSSVSNIGQRAFSMCNNLVSMVVDEENATYYSKNNCIIEKESKILLAGCKTSTIPNDVIAIGNYAFYACYGLESVIIPETVISIGDYAFAGCMDIDSVILGDNVEVIGTYAFSQCSGLTNITIPSSVTTIKFGAFGHCTALGEITFAEDSQLSNIEKYAFSGCAISDITLPKTITVIGQAAFIDCENLENITFLGTTEEWNSITFTFEDNDKVVWNTNVPATEVICSDGTVSLN